MDIKSLKDKILQLAIQGKLVPQDENNESASLLLEKIKAEKEQLIKDKVIKKDKPLPEISEEEIPFKFPSNWKWARLVDLSKNCAVPFADGPFGSNLKSIHYTDNPEVRIIQLSNIGEDGWKDSNVRYTTFKHAETIKRSMVECGDLVIAKMMPAGRTIEVPDNEKAYVLSSDAVKFVPHPKLDKKYLLYAINSEVFKKQINSQVQGTTRVRTSLTKLKGYLVPVPPIEEQKRIVAKVDELFELIDELDNNKQELLENISNTRNKVLQLAIQGKLVEQCEDDEPASVLLERIKAEKEQLIKDKVIKKEKPLPDISEEEKLFKTPSSWEWCRLGNISNIVMGQSPDSSTVSDVEGGIEFHQGKASFGKVFINNSGLYCTKPSKIAIPDDILLSVRAPVGTLNITDRELCIGRGLVAIRKYIDIFLLFYNGS